MEFIGSGRTIVQFISILISFSYKEIDGCDFVGYKMEFIGNGRTDVQFIEILTPFSTSLMVF